MAYFDGQLDLAAVGKGGSIPMLAAVNSLYDAMYNKSYSEAAQETIVARVAMRLTGVDGEVMLRLHDPVIAPWENQFLWSMWYYYEPQQTNAVAALLSKEGDYELLLDFSASLIRFRVWYSAVAYMEVNRPISALTQYGWNLITCWCEPGVTDNVCLMVNAQASTNAVTQTYVGTTPGNDLYVGGRESTYALAGRLASLVMCRPPTPLGTTANSSFLGPTIHNTIRDNNIAVQDFTLAQTNAWGPVVAWPLDEFSGAREDVIGLLNLAGTLPYGPGKFDKRNYAPVALPVAVGLKAWWAFNEVSGTRSDSHGTNHLTDNNTVGYAAGTTLELASDNDPVKLIEDQANSYDGLSNTISRRPIYLASGFGPAKPALYFDGTDDELSSFTIPQVLPCYVYAVVDTTNLQTGYRVLLSRVVGAPPYSVALYLGSDLEPYKPAIYWSTQTYSVSRTYREKYLVRFRIAETEVGIQINGGTEQVFSHAHAALTSWNSINFTGIHQARFLLGHLSIYQGEVISDQKSNNFIDQLFSRHFTVTELLSMTV